MTTLPTTVPLPAIGRLDDIAGADGAQGTVSDLPTYAPLGPQRPLVAKLYDPSVTVSATALSSLVNWRNNLADADRDQLDHLAAWPLQVIYEIKGEARGIVMARVPDRFVQEISGPNSRVSRLREAQWLFLPDDKATKRGIATADRPARLQLCAAFAEAMGLLHRTGVVYGDVSAKNVLYSLDPTPEVYLLDCDSARKAGAQGALGQLNSPDWDDPSDEGSQSVSSDCYKLALFVLRCLSKDLQVRSLAPDVRSSLPPGIIALLDAGLSDQLAGRPSAEDWAAELRAPRQSAAATPGQPQPGPTLRDRPGWKLVGGSWVRTTDPPRPLSTRPIAPEPPDIEEPPPERKGWIQVGGKWVRKPPDAS